MNHIIEALNAVRTAGQEFTKSFNNLADIIETMASENESLHATIKSQDQMILAANRVAIEADERCKAEHARAIKAEHDGWEVAQTLARAKEEFDTLSNLNASNLNTIAKYEVELHELHPFRSTVDKLNLDLATHQDTITTLRSEVSKLLEIILNVATSVDSVVNKPKEEPFSKTLYSDDSSGVKPMVEAPLDGQVGSELIDPDTGENIHSRYYPRAIGA